MVQLEEVQLEQPLVPGLKYLIVLLRLILLVEQIIFLVLELQALQVVLVF